MEMDLPEGYTIKAFNTSDILSLGLLGEVDELVFQAWRDHEPIVAEWLEQQPKTAEIEAAWVWLVRYQEIPVATGRLTIHQSIADLPRAYFFEGLERDLPGPIASLNRLSVIKSHARKGIGSFIDRQRTAKAMELGAKSIVSICQERRAKSLVSTNGFKLLREPRSGAAIPEIKWCVAGKQLALRERPTSISQH